MRAVLNILTILSLLVCTVMAGLWVRSYRTVDYLARDTAYARMEVGPYRGAFVVMSWYLGSAVREGETRWERKNMSMADADGLLGGVSTSQSEHHVKAVGFHFIHEPAKPAKPASGWLLPSMPEYRVAAIPFWALVVGSAILPLVRIRVVGRWVRPRRTAAAEGNIVHEGTRIGHEV